MSFHHELEVATRLALQAGERIRALHRSDLAVDKKEDDSPVTEADRAADAIIRGGLRAEFPDDALLSEETPDDGSRFSRERVWMVDPLDGTKDFVRGQAGFSVMIGLCIGGAPVVGVVYQPVGDKLYRALQGGGAWLGVGGAEPRRLHVSAITDTRQIRMVASKSHRTETIDRIREKLGIGDELNIGSVGLKLGLIAEGERDLYVNPQGHSKLWDACAPEVILTEAGGRLTDAHGQPLRYRGRELGNRHGLIASNGLVHDEVVARLAELFPRREPAGE